MTNYFVFHSGTLVNSIGFEWMLVGIAFLCFCYAPLLSFLRAPPTKEEKKVGSGEINHAMSISEKDIYAIEMSKTSIDHVDKNGANIYPSVPEVTNEYVTKL